SSSPLLSSVFSRLLALLILLLFLSLLPPPPTSTLFPYTTLFRSFKSRPQRGQILHFTPPTSGLEKWPVIMPLTNLSIVPFADHLVIGATHENNAGFNTHITAGGVHEILSKALDVIPDLASWAISDTRVGFRPMTPGSIPVIGTLPGNENLFIGNGLGASGLTTGPYVGEQLAKLVLGEELDIDLANYDINNVIDQ